MSRRFVIKENITFVLFSGNKVSIPISTNSFSIIMDAYAARVRKHLTDLENGYNVRKIKNLMEENFVTLESFFETDFFRPLENYDWSFGEDVELNAKIDIIENLLQALLTFEFQYVLALEYPPLVRKFCDKYIQYIEDHFI